MKAFTVFPRDCCLLVLLASLYAAPISVFAEEEKFSQYVDSSTGVVKTPQGFADNDDCWRTSWYYASLLALKQKDEATFNELVAEHGVSLEGLTKFLTYFRDNCTSDEGWKRPTTLRVEMTMDQLVSLLYLLACIDE